MTTATGDIRPRFRANRLLQTLVTSYSLIWLIAAVNPIDRRAWLLENVMVFVTLFVLAATYRHFPLSDVSYLLLWIFLVLHAVSAHYNYARVPLGYWVQETFELSRNHSDRVAHFAWGFCAAYPFREVFLRLGKIRNPWTYFLAVDSVLALSGLFEICESWVVRWVDPRLGAEYLGSQGDVWDAQKDMTVALLGAILSMSAAALFRRRRSRLPAARDRQYSSVR